MEARVLQVLDALVNDIDRDLDRDITILRTLATSQALASADWPTFYNQARAGLQGRAYLVLVDVAGRQLVNTYVPYGKQPAITGDLETVHRITDESAGGFQSLYEPGGEEAGVQRLNSDSARWRGALRDEPRLVAR
jgi:hypothetical protein